MALWWQPILIEWCQYLEKFLIVAALCMIANSIIQTYDGLSRKPLLVSFCHADADVCTEVHLVIGADAQMEDVIIVQMDGRIMKGKQTTATRPNISLHFLYFLLSWTTGSWKCCRRLQNWFSAWSARVLATNRAKVMGCSGANHSGR